MEPKSLSDFIDNEAPTLEVQPSETQEDSPELVLFEQMVNTLQKLDNSLAVLRIDMTSFRMRLELVEKFLAYLMSKDPEAAERVKAMAEAAEQK